MTKKKQTSLYVILMKGESDSYISDALKSVYTNKNLADISVKEYCDDYSIEDEELNLVLYELKPVRQYNSIRKQTILDYKDIK